MFSFADSPTRQRFLARFEADGDGYLYHRRPDAAPVRISAKDHQFMVDGFDTSRLQLPFVAVLGVAAVCLLVWLGIDFGRTSGTRAMDFLPLPIVALAFVLAWWADLWDEPTRALFQRAKDTHKTGGLTWLTKSAGNWSWKGSLIFWWLIIPSATRHLGANRQTTWDWLLGAWLLVGVALYALIAIRKVQINRARSLPYLNQLN